MFIHEMTKEEKQEMKAEDYHIHCADCGHFIRKELWIRKDHKYKKHGLCQSCFGNYDDPSCL